jgi:hypothetical protein
VLLGKMNQPLAEVDRSVDAQVTARGTWRLRAYVLVVLLIPALFLGASVPIVRSASFPADSGDPFLLNPDYAFELAHQDCDVVIFGDSTAVTGLDPTVVGPITGLKTCNIAQSQSAIEIMGTAALDSYLRNNRPPKYIVMQFAPETFARSRSEFFWPEGLTILLRRRSILEALPTLLRHPVQAYNFAMWAIKARVAAAIRGPVDFSATQAIFHSHAGLLILPKPPEAFCEAHTPYAPPATEWVRMLKERYTQNGTRVLVNVAPIPECAPNAAVIADGTRRLTDNRLELYPIQLFCDLDRHLTLAGAERASRELAAQLRAANGS